MDRLLTLLSLTCTSTVRAKLPRVVALFRCVRGAELRATTFGTGHCLLLFFICLHLSVVCRLHLPCPIASSSIWCFSFFFFQSSFCLSRARTCSSSFIHVIILLSHRLCPRRFALPLSSLALGALLIHPLPPTCAALPRLQDGSLRIVRNGIGLDERATIEMEGIQGMWPLKLADGSEETVLGLAFVGQSAFLALRGEEVRGVVSGFGFARAMWQGLVSWDRSAVSLFTLLTHLSLSPLLRG